MAVSLVIPLAQDRLIKCLMRAPRPVFNGFLCYRVCILCAVPEMPNPATALVSTSTPATPPWLTGAYVFVCKFFPSWLTGWMHFQISNAIFKPYLLLSHSRCFNNSDGDFLIGEEKGLQMFFAVIFHKKDDSSIPPVPILFFRFPCVCLSLSVCVCSPPAG